MSGLASRAKAALARRSAMRWMVLLGALLCAPSLDTGLVADDYIHAIALRGIPSPAPVRNRLDLFDFADGDPRRGQAILDAGEFPWAARPDVRFSFFRPLSAVTHWLDYRLWPASPWLMHLQSLAWFALAIWLASLCYRRFFVQGGQAAVSGKLAAGLATLAFALDPAHGPVVGWIANRNSLVAFDLALPVLLLHDQARRAGERRAMLLAPLSLFIALFAGESALGICGYLAAHALCIDRDTPRRRAISLASYLFPLIAWRAIYSRLGYGVSGSGVYLDPIHSPLAFLRALPIRLPILLLGQLGLPWSDGALLYPQLAGWLTGAVALVAIAALSFIAWAAMPLFRAGATTRFFALGMLLSVLPVCATVPSDRLLMFAGLGAMGLLAQLCIFAVSRQARIARVYLVVCHFVIAPLFLPWRSRSMATIEALIDLADRTIPRSPDIAGKTVILLNPPSEIFGAFVAPMRRALGIPRPERFRVLTADGSPLDISRLDANTLRVHPAHGFLEQEPSRLLRGLDEPFRPGETIPIAGLDIHIESVTRDSRPDAIDFEFDRSLDDPSLVWLDWSDTGYARWAPPRIGATTQLPAHDFFAAALYALGRASGK